MINKTTLKGNFCPEHSRINFACLNEKHLVNNCCNLPQIIKPEMLKSALGLLDKIKKYVMSIDGKKIAAGLGKNDTGDINLWGHEYPNKGFKMLPNLLSKISGYISRIRNMEIGHRKLLTRLEKLHVNNPDKSKDYEFGMDSVKAYIFITVDWIQQALFTNKEICSVMSSVNVSRDNFCVQYTVNLDYHTNVRELLNVEDVPEDIDLNVNTELVKQRSDKWHELRKKCVISASSSFNAIGLQTLKDQKSHHK